MKNILKIISKDEFIQNILDTLSPIDIAPALIRNNIPEDVAVAHEIKAIKQALNTLSKELITDHLTVGFDQIGFAYLASEGVVVYDGSGLGLYPTGKTFLK